MNISRTTFSKPLLASALALAGLGLAGQANAAVQLSVELFDAGNASFYSNFVTDGGAGDLDGLANGQIVLGTSTPTPLIAGYNITNSVFGTNTFYGSSADFLTSGSTAVQNSTGQTITAKVAFGATGFNDTVIGADLRGAGSFLQGTGSLEFIYCLDSGNVQGADSSTDCPGTSTTSGVLTGGSPNYVGFLGQAASDPYSMTQMFNLVLDDGAGVILSGRAQNMAAVPEPATMSLLGAGLVGLAAARRRKAKAKAEANAEVQA